MPRETATIASRKQPNSPRDGWQMSAGVVDRRSRAWRRRSEIVAMFRSAIAGEIDPVLASKIEVAAELAVAAEVARAKFMAGDGSVSADDYVRAQNIAFRAENALHLAARQKPAAPATSLRDRLLAKKAAAEAASAA